ncbi:CsbD family protein [Streptomyces sp. NPDC055189]
MADTGGTDKMKGTADEMAGKAVGDRGRHAVGKTEQTGGEPGKVMGEARDRAGRSRASLRRRSG